jgi:hypothetical protein
MLPASCFPGIKLVHEESSVRKMRRPSEAARRPSMSLLRRRESKSWVTPLQASVGAPTPSNVMHLDTELARKGSNFGLPIALQLTKLMRGAVGIVSVRGQSSLLSLTKPMFHGL